MSFVEMLNINTDKKNVISFVGAGGKTTTMFEVANEMKELGKKTLVTTTTKIFFPDKNQFDGIIISEDYDEIINTVKKYPDRLITVICGGIIATNKRENGMSKKLKGIDKSCIARLYSENFFDVILVEADGAKGKQVKAPNAFEPVTPRETNLVVGIIGFECYGKPIAKEWVHRPELFAEIARKELGGKIDCESLVNLIISKYGLFKDSPVNSKCIAVLNVKKTDGLLREKAESVAELALEKSKISDRIVKITDVVVNII
ncbi:MAG: selenium cofactor biosynthesis protein YqeC [Alkaliphilus sp.]